MTLYLYFTGILSCFDLRKASAHNNPRIKLEERHYGAAVAPCP